MNFRTTALRAATAGAAILALAALGAPLAQAAAPAHEHARSPQPNAIGMSGTIDNRTPFSLAYIPESGKVPNGRYSPVPPAQIKARSTDIFGAEANGGYGLAGALQYRVLNAANEPVGVLSISFEVPMIGWNSATCSVTGSGAGPISCKGVTAKGYTPAMTFTLS
jgi:hypothetical protein